MTLRISAPSRDGRNRRGPGGEELEPDFYMSRLIKLLPAEAIAIYPMLQDRAVTTVMTAHDETQAAARRAGFSDSNGPAQAAEAAPITMTDLARLPRETATEHWLPILITWLVLMLVIVVRWQATRDDRGNAQWGAVAIAAVSFFLWVPTMHGSFGIIEFFEALGMIDWPDAIERFVPEVLLIFWTVLIPGFYKPEPGGRP